MVQPPTKKSSDEGTPKKPDASTSAVVSASPIVADPALAAAFAAAIQQLSKLPATDLASMTDQLSRIHPSEFAGLLSQCAAKAADDGDNCDGDDDDDDVDADYEDDRDAVRADIKAYTAMYGTLSTQ